MNVVFFISQDRMVPHSLQKKLKHRNIDLQDLEQEASVSILCLKLLNLIGAKAEKSSEAGSSISFVEKMDYADRKLHELCKQHRAFKVDYCDKYVILCGIGSTSGEQKHMISACKIAMELINCELTKEKELNWQGVLHKGAIHTGLVNNGLPKCFVVGDPIEKAHELLKHSTNDRILVSSQFAGALKEIPDCKFQITPTGDKLRIQVSGSVKSELLMITMENDSLETVCILVFNISFV